MMKPTASVPKRCANRGEFKGIYMQTNIPAIAALLTLAVSATILAGADSQLSAAEKQRKLIAILQSDAPPQEKAITCKQLAIYGTKDAVPVLAPLLSDPQLTSWARIALEAIPDPAADNA